MAHAQNHETSQSGRGVAPAPERKKLGMRLGNWLTPEQGHALWQEFPSYRLKGKRDRALLAMLLAYGRLDEVW
jgi:hypothetical protein